MEKATQTPEVYEVSGQRKMGKEVIAVVGYFSIFKYPPNLDEIYTFFPKKTSKKAVKMAILKLERQKKIISVYERPAADLEGQRYTLGEYTTREYTSDLARRKKISHKKLHSWRFRAFLRLISYLPQVKLIGLSGSISMLNAKKGDDIDLFIISAKKRLFTARFFCLLISQLMSLRRKFGDREAKDKVCLNLFFDESDLKIPKNKQTVFVGHEIIQMKPLVNKNSTYEKFLQSNPWVYRLFPNHKRKKPTFVTKLPTHTNFIGDMVELMLKYLEIKLINSHKTTELITDTQLWFHPDDFEKKIKKK